MVAVAASAGTRRGHGRAGGDRLGERGAREHERERDRVGAADVGDLRHRRRVRERQAEKRPRRPERHVRPQILDAHPCRRREQHAPERGRRPAGMRAPSRAARTEARIGRPGAACPRSGATRGRRAPASAGVIHGATTPSAQSVPKSQTADDALSRALGAGSMSSTGSGATHASQVHANGGKTSTWKAAPRPARITARMDQAGPLAVELTRSARPRPPLSILLTLPLDRRHRVRLHLQRRRLDPPDRIPASFSGRTASCPRSGSSTTRRSAPASSTSRASSRSRGRRRRTRDAVERVDRGAPAGHGAPLRAREGRSSATRSRCPRRRARRRDVRAHARQLPRERARAPGARHRRALPRAREPERAERSSSSAPTTASTSRPRSISSARAGSRRSYFFLLALGAGHGAPAGDRVPRRARERHPPAGRVAAALRARPRSLGAAHVLAFHRSFALLLALDRATHLALGRRVPRRARPCARRLPPAVVGRRARAHAALPARARRRLAGAGADAAHGVLGRQHRLSAQLPDAHVRGLSGGDRLRDRAPRSLRRRPHDPPDGRLRRRDRRSSRSSTRRSLALVDYAVLPDLARRAGRARAGDDGAGHRLQPAARPHPGVGRPLYFRAPYDYRTTVTAASQALTSILDVDELVGAAAAAS